MEVARQSGLGDGAVERNFGQRLGYDPAHLYKLVEIDPGLASHRLEEERCVLDDDVAGRAGRVGAAAESAERGVELAAAGIVSGQYIGDAQPTRVVKMCRDGQRRDIGDDLPEHAFDRR